MKKAQANNGLLGLFSFHLVENSPNDAILHKMLE